MQAGGRTAGLGGAAPAGPSARYILPTFEERTAYGFKRQDPYAKLFEDRIIFLGVQIDDASADDVMAQLLVLESQDPDRDITLYINSPGGSQTALTAIYDTMQYIKPHVQTVCLGQAASAAAVLLAAGSPGKRLALPNARVMIHQPRIEGGSRAQASDIEIYAEEMVRMREWLEYTLAKHTGQPESKIRDDIERDRFLSAQAAKDYGLVDQVLESRKGVDTVAPDDRASAPVLGTAKDTTTKESGPDGSDTKPKGIE
ncbi:MAG: ATP-dependent Clp protease proteolytic subunit [Demequina sp.]